MAAFHADDSAPPLHATAPPLHATAPHASAPHVTPPDEDVPRGSSLLSRRPPPRALLHQPPPPWHTLAAAPSSSSCAPSISPMSATRVFGLDVSGGIRIAPTRSWRSTGAQSAAPAAAGDQTGRLTDSLIWDRVGASRSPPQFVPKRGSGGRKRARVVRSDDDSDGDEQSARSGPRATALSTTHGAAVDGAPGSCVGLRQRGDEAGLSQEGLATGREHFMRPVSSSPTLSGTAASGSSMLSEQQPRIRERSGELHLGSTREQAMLYQAKPDANAMRATAGWRGGAAGSTGAVVAAPCLDSSAAVEPDSLHTHEACCQRLQPTARTPLPPRPTVRAVRVTTSPSGGGILDACDDKDDFDVKIPCEFCHVLLPASRLDGHQHACPHRFRASVPAPTAPVPRGAASAATTPPQHSSNDGAVAGHAFHGGGDAADDTGRAPRERLRYVRSARAAATAAAAVRHAAAFADEIEDPSSSEPDERQLRENPTVRNAAASSFHEDGENPPGGSQARTPRSSLEGLGAGSSAPALIDEAAAKAVELRAMAGRVELHADPRPCEGARGKSFCGRVRSAQTLGVYLLFLACFPRCPTPSSSPLLLLLRAEPFTRHCRTGHVLPHFTSLAMLRALGERHYVDYEGQFDDGPTPARASGLAFEAAESLTHGTGQTKGKAKRGPAARETWRHRAGKKVYIDANGQQSSGSRAYSKYSKAKAKKSKGPCNSCRRP